MMKRIIFFIFLISLILPATSVDLAEETELNQTCTPAKPCAPGLILPVWQPQIGLTTGDIFFRAAIYLIALFYLFLGVSIVADRFMAAIEVITSQETEVTLKKPTGEPYTILVRVWNETVSNLTLMALGSSAPEILLSIIEIFGNNFEAGELGPGTIVGSAAYNLFIIIAICIIVIPDGEVRRIARNDVFWVTVIWSTFAYIWLYLILGVISPNVVEAWEGILTFAFFFLTVINAYIANRYFPSLGTRYLKGKAVTSYTSRTATYSNKGGEVRLENGDGTPAEQTDSLINTIQDPDVLAFEEHKQLFWDTFTKIRAEHPDLDIKEVGKLTAWQALAKMPKSRAVRRVQAIRKLTAGVPLFREFDQKAEDIIEPLVPEKETKITVSFSPSQYICMENIEKVFIQVEVDRGSIQEPTIVTVHYKTIEDSAKAGADYEPIQGIITFLPHEIKLSVPIQIIDNEKYESDQKFHVHIYQAKAVSANDADKEYPATVGVASDATIIIVDDDHAGAFSFASEVFKVTENIGTFKLKVNRTRGARGNVNIPYTITEGTAKLGIDMEAATSGTLHFKDGVTSMDIPIKIINDDKYEKAEDFFVFLGDPIWQNSNQKSENEADGKPVLGAHVRAKIIVTEDQEFKHFIDKLIAKANCSVMVGTSSWKQQFSEALTVGIDEEDTPDGPPHKPSLLQVIIHYIALPWKLLFSLIPPTDYAHGWICFIVSIIFIGILTAFIGDVAAHFGCTIGLKDAVTAITLVAMGTSLPDTFASKTAATQDKTADASIGNVTGSNAVNVFLGIGVAWAIASCYHAWNGTVFRVSAGTLAPSVALFCLGSIICFAVLQFRRYSPNIRAELGGPTSMRYLSASIFVLVWISYITYSILDAYCYI